jgi:hypothetical protein
MFRQHPVNMALDTLKRSARKFLRTFKRGVVKSRFTVITCEHNNTGMRESVHALLTSHGYARKFEDLTKFEDWYVLEPPPEPSPCAA